MAKFQIIPKEVMLLSLIRPNFIMLEKDKIYCVLCVFLVIVAGAFYWFEPCTLVRLWRNGGWLALCVSMVTTSIVFLLIAHHRIARSIWFFTLLFLGLLSGFIPLEITADEFKHLFENKESAKSLFEDFGVGLISLILTFVTGIVLWTVKDAEDRLKNRVEEIKGVEQTTNLMAFNNRCFSYFNRLLNERSQARQASQLQRIVELFEVNFKEKEKLLIHLSEIRDSDLGLLLRLPESRSYLTALQDYYSDKNKGSDESKKIVRECRRLLMSR